MIKTRMSTKIFFANAHIIFPYISINILVLNGYCACLPLDKSHVKRIEKFFLVVNIPDMDHLEVQQPSCSYTMSGLTQLTPTQGKTSLKF